MMKKYIPRGHPNEQKGNNERAYVYSSWNHNVRDFQKNSAFVSNKSSGNHVYRIQLNSRKSSLPLQPLSIESCYTSIEKYYSFVCWQHQIYITTFFFTLSTASTVYWKFNLVSLVLHTLCRNRAEFTISQGWTRMKCKISKIENYCFDQNFWRFAAT